MMNSADRAAAGRVMAALLQMTKLEIEGLRKAFDSR